MHRSTHLLAATAQISHPARPSAAGQGAGREREADAPLRSQATGNPRERHRVLQAEDSVRAPDPAQAQRWREGPGQGPGLQPTLRPSAGPGPGPRSGDLTTLPAKCEGRWAHGSGTLGARSGLHKPHQGERSRDGEQVRAWITKDGFILSVELMKRNPTCIF